METEINTVVDNHKRTRRIKILAKDVVDRIAAGEIVQGPSSVAKELIENSLDAECNNIEVQCSSGGFGLLSVSDDGKGIHPDDFTLAVTRFATSKLVSFDDLKSIQTFGFRGEALASTSMVSRLSIISKCRPTTNVATGKDDARSEEKGRESHCAYKQSFTDGKPTSGKPTPIAGTFGTLIKVEDLFYNIPSRRRAFDGSRKESEEYQKVLLVAQRYAIHKARDGIGFICRKQGGNCDLNTSNLMSIKKIQETKRKYKDSIGGGQNDAEPVELLENWASTATKEAISHVFGSQLSKELLYLECSEGDLEGVTRAALRDMKTDEDKKADSSTLALIAKSPFEIKEARYESTMLNDTDSSTITKSSGLLETIQMDSNDVGMKLASASSSSDVDSNRFAYRAFGFMSNGTYCVPKASSAFILFINDRLVESASLRRAIENIYTVSIPKGAKPFLYLSLYLPGPHVDVNIHPTKREVAFLHMDLLCEALVSAARKILFSSTRTFQTQALVAGEKPASVRVSKSTNVEDKSAAEAPLHERRRLENDRAGLETYHAEIGSIADKDDSDMLQSTYSGNKEAPPNKQPLYKSDSFSSTVLDNNSKRPKITSHSHLNVAKKTYDPKNLVRVVQQQGALEPYLTEINSNRKSLNVSDETTAGAIQEGIMNIEHLPSCELSNQSSMTIDLNIPGAFASICRCQIGGKEKFAANTMEFIIKPKMVEPTSCNLVSIRKLRSDVLDRVNDLWTTKLREAIFVGCVSRHRSLWQWGVELLLVHHSNLARELFYQLALIRFSGAAVGLLDEGGVNVRVLIEYALQFEEDSSREEQLNHDENCIPDTNETNKILALQATQCLAEKAIMLKEYFSICFETKTESEELYLVGLPVLLDGFSPTAHYIPIFLLRLATEVDWTEENSCFDSICTELAYFYAEFSYPEEDISASELLGAKEKKFIQHVIFPSLSALLHVPNDLISDGSMMKVALLSQLYKVFERC